MDKLIIFNYFPPFVNFLQSTIHILTFAVSSAIILFVCLKKSIRDKSQLAIKPTVVANPKESSKKPTVPISKSRSSSDTKNSKHSDSQNADLEHKHENGVESTQKSPVLNRSPGTNEVHNENRRVWAKRASQKKCSQLSLEHKNELKNYVAPNLTFKACEANFNANRYADVYCIDENRVVLKNRPTDFIHASWVEIPDDGGKYICAQGPLPETIVDFWQMIYQEKVKIVLMLNSFEEGNEKCAVYYPLKKGATEKYGNFTVENVEEKTPPIEGISMILLKLRNRDAKDEKPREILHLSALPWPDQLAPPEAQEVLKLSAWVTETNNSATIPVVVHCSAGVGRTVTYVGIHFADSKIKKNSSVELVDIVRELRALRYQAIQSHVQYLFLHVCLLELYIQKGVIEREGTVSKFIEQYRSHALKKIEKRKTAKKESNTDNELNKAHKIESES